MVVCVRCHSILDCFQGLLSQIQPMSRHCRCRPLGSGQISMCFLRRAPESDAAARLVRERNGPPPTTTHGQKMQRCRVSPGYPIRRAKASR